MKERVGVLMGGMSAERHVSLSTGEGVAQALADRGHEVVKIVIDPDRAPLDELLRNARIDVAFLALHGRGGEDGCVQGLLEWMQIPYTGSGVLASALAMDKLKSKELFRLHNVPTPPYYIATEETLDVLEAVHGSFGFPVIVKPRNEGSSVGVARADDLDALRRAIQLGLNHDAYVLVERYVKGMEVHVGIFDGRVLGGIEIVSQSGIFDYVSKYTPGLSETICPPRLDATRTGGVMNLALRAYKALECSGACRIDLLVTEGENEYVLEVNTSPGLTETSLLPKIAASAGIDYGTLCEMILRTASLRAGLATGPREEAPRSSESSALRSVIAQAQSLVRAG